MSSNTWQLFVDESGAFEKQPNRPSVVAGLLLQHENHPDLEAALRKKLSDAYPMIPYPPHATDLNMPASRVAACLVWEAQSPGKRPASDKATFSACAEAIKSVRSIRHDYKDFLAVVERGGWPTWELLYATTSQMKAETLPPIRKLMQAQDLHMGKVLDTILKNCPCCTLLASRSGLPHEQPTGIDYMSQLRALFERVLMLLASQDPVPTDLLLHIAERRVPNDRAGVELPIVSRDVQEAWQQAEEALFGQSRNVRLTGVHAVAQLPPAYDGNVHPGVVIADFVSNRLCGPAGDGGTSLNSLRSYVRKRTGLPMAMNRRGVTSDDPLPTVTACGRPTEAVRDAYRNLPKGASVKAVQPRWAREQAVEWIAALRPGLS